jgi:hypothetical protein
MKYFILSVVKRRRGTKKEKIHSTEFQSKSISGGRNFRGSGHHDYTSLSTIALIVRILLNHPQRDY